MLTEKMTYTVSTITPGAPGGIGIREAVMIMMCGSFLDMNTIMLYAVTLRIISTFGDIAAFLIGMLLEQVWKRQKQKNA